MTYIIFSISTALFFAITFFLRKQASASLSLQTALVIEVFIQLVILVAIFFLTAPELKKGFDLRSNGVWYAVLAGIFVVVGVGSNFLALKNGGLSKVVAITSPSQIIFGVLIGVIILKETLTIQQMIGMGLSILGIVLVVW